MESKDLRDPALARSLFKEHGVQELLTQTIEGDTLSPEAESLLHIFGANLLMNITERACLTAKSRGNKFVDKEDIQFVTSQYYQNPQNPNIQPPELKETGSPEHQQKLDLVKKFHEMNDNNNE